AGGAGGLQGPVGDDLPTLLLGQDQPRPLRPARPAGVIRRRRRRFLRPPSDRGRFAPRTPRGYLSPERGGAFVLFLDENIPAGGNPEPVARLRAEARRKACGEAAQYRNRSYRV